MKARGFLAVSAAALLLAAAGLAAIPAAGDAADLGGRAVDLGAEYERARAEFNAFLQSPERFKNAGRWNSFEERFRKIYERDRGGARADEALFMIGEVNYERHRVHRSRAHLDAATSAYRRLLETYRFSSRAGDALVRLADIHYYNLNDSRRAYLLYRRAARTYPDTEAGRLAGVRVVAIEARHPEFRAQDDAPLAGIVPAPGFSKPLPSPGAVVGGRRGSVPRSAAAPDASGSADAASSGAGAAGQAGLPGRPLEDGAGSEARATVATPARPPAEAGRGRPAHPLLEEGPLPLKRPSDELPPLRSIRP